MSPAKVYLPYFSPPDLHGLRPAAIAQGSGSRNFAISRFKSSQRTTSRDFSAQIATAFTPSILAACPRIREPQNGAEKSKAGSALHAVVPGPSTAPRRRQKAENAGHGGGAVGLWGASGLAGRAAAKLRLRRAVGGIFGSFGDLLCGGGGSFCKGGKWGCAWENSENPPILPGQFSLALSECFLDLVFLVVLDGQQEAVCSGGCWWWQF